MGLGIVFGDDSHGFHIGFGLAFDVGVKNFGVDINASHTWSTDGSNTTTFNLGANVNFGILGVGANLGYSYNSMSGSTFSAYAGANVVAVGLGIGYNRYWNTSGNFIGAYGYIGGYVGIPGVATYGGGYQWGNGACTTGWYNTQSLFGFNWRDGSFQGFNLNMNICSYNSNDPNNNATLYTQHGNPVGHSIIDGNFNGQSFSIDWGPKTQFVPGQSNVLPYIFGCPSSNMFDDDQQKGPYNPTELSCVSVSALYQYSCFLNVVQGILPYSVLYSSCSSLAAAAIYSGGMSYLGISPFSLEFLAKNKF